MDWSDITSRTVVCNKYHNQKVRAKRRGIEWQFTLESWIVWWGDDLAKRGSKKGCLVMARYNDEGPYHPDNCRKLTVEENTLEARRGGRGFFQNHTPETRAKISAKMKIIRNRI